MRTTLDIPQDLLEEARRISRLKSKTDIVIHSLQEFIRKNKIERLIALRGKLRLPHIEKVYLKSRGRPLPGRK
ncbi:MAG TPA: type II toxin-antitoxin system VapB family antitoxin [Bdellovibrionota bacterium]|nr:type II toxin-antitoxin system VapB family antitoxin [Bdellovibrionota bacterium]